MNAIGFKTPTKTEPQVNRDIIFNRTTEYIRNKYLLMSLIRSTSTPERLDPYGLQFNAELAVAMNRMCGDGRGNIRREPLRTTIPHTGDIPDIEDAYDICNLVTFKVTPGVDSPAYNITTMTAKTRGPMRLLEKNASRESRIYF